MKLGNFLQLTTLLISVLMFQLLPSNIFAGGGPQFVCKEMAQKQGWLIDSTRFDEELSDNACISRNPTIEEKDKILEFCKAEPKGEFRTDCLDKCRNYYSEISFRECSKNEISSIKSQLFVSKIKSNFNRQPTLVEAIIVAFVVVLALYILFTLVKSKKASNKQTTK